MVAGAELSETQKAGCRDPATPFRRRLETVAHPRSFSTALNQSI
jgi:hypothetical protein